MAEGLVAVRDPGPRDMVYNLCDPARVILPSCSIHLQIYKTRGLDDPQPPRGVVKTKRIVECK